MYEYDLYLCVVHKCNMLSSRMHAKCMYVRAVKFRIQIPLIEFTDFPFKIRSCNIFPFFYFNVNFVQNENILESTKHLTDSCSRLKECGIPKIKELLLDLGLYLFLKNILPQGGGAFHCTGREEQWV